jgi:hypothetical protein
VSIGEIGDELRRAIAALPFVEVQQAADHLDQAMTTLVYVGQGSGQAELENALAYFAQGRQQLGEAAQTLVLLRQTIERFIESIGATGGGGGGGIPLPGGAPTPRDSTSGAAGGTGKDWGRTGPSDRGGRWIDPALIADVQRQGHKISPGQVVRIGRDLSGRVVWLETGDRHAGRTHLLLQKRVGDFGSHGIGPDAIVDLVFQAATRGTPVGTSGKDRVVFELVFQGVRRRVAVTVGSNGFIIGGHPVSLTKKVKPLP